MKIARDIRPRRIRLKYIKALLKKQDNSAGKVE